jgi:hypothetical protein
MSTHRQAIAILRNSAERHRDIAGDRVHTEPAEAAKRMAAADAIEASIAWLEHADAPEPSLAVEMVGYRDHLIDLGQGDLDSPPEVHQAQLEAFRTGWERHQELSIPGAVQ